jgi:GTP-binding protein HflX
LEEAVLADFIILVMDASNPYVNEHRTTTLEVLKELGAVDVDIVSVLNKSDLLDEDTVRACLRSRYPKAIFLSTVTGEGVGELMGILEKMSDSSVDEVEVVVPPSRHDVIALAHDVAEVVSIAYEPDGSANMQLIIPRERSNLFDNFIVS